MTQTCYEPGIETLRAPHHAVQLGCAFIAKNQAVGFRGPCGIALLIDNSSLTRTLVGPWQGPAGFSRLTLGEDRPGTPLGPTAGWRAGGRLEGGQAISVGERRRSRVGPQGLRYAGDMRRCMEKVRRRKIAEEGGWGRLNFLFQIVVSTRLKFRPPEKNTRKKTAWPYVRIGTSAQEGKRGKSAAVSSPNHSEEHPCLPGADGGTSHQWFSGRKPAPITS